MLRKYICGELNQQISDMIMIVCIYGFSWALYNVLESKWMWKKHHTVYPGPSHGVPMRVDATFDASPNANMNILFRQIFVFNTKNTLETKYYT